MNRKRIFSRKQKRKSRGSDSGAANRFLDQFDTKLRFRELEPRVVLTATAGLDVNGVLQVTTDAPTDDVQVRFYDNSGVATYEVTNNGKFVDEFVASTVKGIEANDVSGSQVDSQKLTLLDDHTTLDPNLSLGLETKGIEEVEFKGSNVGDSWTFDKMVTIEAVKYDAEVSQNGADLLTPSGTPVTFFAIDGAKIDVNLQSTTNEISKLAVGHGGEVKIATSQDLAVNSSNADLLQLTAPNVELGADTFSSQFGALKIDLTGSGDITQKGDVTVTGATDLDVIGGKVLLNNSGNDFQGAVSVNATNIVDADMATIADKNDLQLGDVRTANLTAITGGNLTQATGTTVEVTSFVDFQFTTAGKTLDLQNAGNLLPSDDAKFLLSGPESPTNFYLRNDATDAAIPLAIATLADTGSLNDLTLIYTQNTTAIALPNIDITGDLVYQAKGVIAQTALTSIKVDGNASFKTLDDQSIFVDMSDNEFNVISATGTTKADVVAINDKDGGLDLDQIAATTLTVHTVGTLGNVDNASVVVSGNAKLTGDVAVTLGNKTSDLLAFGSLTFISPGGVSIAEDGDTLLTGANSAASLVLHSTGKIENVVGTELKVSGNASLTADDGDDLNANNQITLGQDVTDDFEFVSLTFNSVDAVKITETGSTDLVGKSTAGSLVLKSSDAITNQDNAELNVVGDASFIASTAITLGDKTDDSFTFGTLTFDAVGAVSIAEDDSTKLSGKSKSDSLVLDSTGAIQNAANAEVVVTNNAKFIAGTSITLGNETSDVIQFGSLTFDSDFSVSIKEDDSTVLSGTSQAATLVLQSTGSITNEMGAKLYVDYSAQFVATDGLNNGNNKITLGDQTGDVFQFGSLRFDTVDAVSIAEDNDTLLEGASKAGSLYLASTGKIENKANASLTVDGNAEFSAGTDIKLGSQSGDSFYFGTLTFAGNVVAIAEDNATVLTGTNTATSLDLKSTDTITDKMATSVVVTGPATFTATNEITLADDADTLHVTGLTAFDSTADKAITIGDASSSTQFGSLSFNGGAVDIQESDATILSGANTATSVMLTSGGSITDASMTTVVVSGAATFAAKDEITLANESGDKLDIGGLATFTSSDNDAIAVGGAASTTYFGSLTFSGGMVVIQEDDSTLLAGANAASSLNLESSGAITDDSTTKVTVTGAATFTAKDEITLANETNDKLDVGGLATFKSLDGDGIAVGASDSLTYFGSLNFNGGVVVIQEDDSTLLTGSNSASSLELSSLGKIENDPGTTLIVSGNAKFTADDGNSLNGNNQITLGQDGTDDFEFGSLTFNSVNTVTIAETGGMLLTGSNSSGTLFLSATGKIENLAGTKLIADGVASLTADDGDNLNGNNQITLGQNGTDDFEFLALTFNSADAVKIAETGNTLLTGSSSAGSLVLHSTGKIENAGGTKLIVAGNASLTADDGDDLNANNQISLGQNGTDDFEFGSLTFNSADTVVIAEIGDTHLTGASAAKTLNLSSTGKIDNEVGAKLIVTSLARFTADDANAVNANNQILLGQDGSDDFEFGSLTFNTVDAVKIAETGSTLLENKSTAGSLELKSTGSITNQSSAKLDVTGNAYFMASVDITLGDQIDDKFTFGSLTFDGGAVVIQEDDSTELSGSSSASSLELTSGGAITDASMTEVEVVGAATFTAKDEILLANETDDRLEVGSLATFKSLDGDAITLGASDSTTSFGSLNFNGGAVVIQEDDSTLLTGDNTASSLELSSLGKIENVAGTKLIVGGNAKFTADDGNAGNANNQITLGQNMTDDFEFVSLTFNTVDAVKIAETGSTDLAGVSTAGSLELKSTGSITNQMNAKLDVTGNANFMATVDITLGDQTGDSFTFQSLTFAGQTLAIEEDDSTQLTGMNSAASLELKSGGSITDDTATAIDIGGAATFQAQDAITLADESGDDLDVDGLATFVSVNGAAIMVGGDNSTTDFGSLNFNGGAVTIQQDGDVLLDGVNSADSLNLSTIGKIENVAGTELKVSGNAKLTADDSDDNNTNNQITLGQGVGDDFEFLTLTFNTVDAVMIAETGSTELTGSNTAGSLDLKSTGAITDASMTLIDVSGAATFTAQDEITLADESGDEFYVDGLATFVSLGDKAIQVGGANSMTNFGSLSFDGGAVTIQQDGDVLLDGTNSASSLMLSAAGKMEDAANSSLVVTGNASLTAASITLGDTGTDTVKFDSLTFDSTGAVAIEEDDATLLTGVNKADSLSLKSAGSITDEEGTSLDVNGVATLTAATFITLADKGTDLIDIGGLATFVSLGAGAIDVGVDVAMADGSDSGAMVNFGQLTFVSDDGMMGRGAVTIREDSGTQLTGDNKASDLYLASAGAITDASTTTIDATGKGTFTAADEITLADTSDDVLTIGGVATFVSLGAGAIDVGVNVAMADGSDSGAQVNFGQLTFVSDDGVLGRGAVTIREDSSTEIAGDNKASDLFLASAGAITDEAMTKIDATGAAVFTAQDAITLADTMDDELTVDGMATFISLDSAAITIGGDGLTLLGMLNFNGGAVVIQEDDSTQLSGDNVADSLELTSDGSIEDKPTTSLDVENAATFTAATFITLADNSTDVIDIGGLATFVSLGADAIDVGVDVMMADGTDSGAQVNFGQLTFVSDDGLLGRGAVTIREDSSTEIAGENKASDLFLASAGAITDEAMTKIDATGAAIFTAQDAITLADVMGDELTIAGMATFISLNSGAIQIGGDGLTELGMLNFNTGGAVVIQEDDSTQLSGDNFADSLELTSVVSIEDKPDTSIDVQNDATFTAGTFITLSDTSGDLIDVGGLAAFISLGADAINVGVDVMMADGSDSGAEVNFGQLTFVSDDGVMGRGAVTIREDSSTEITGDNKASDLFLASAGAITDDAMTTIDATGAAKFTAQDGITLADVMGDELTVGGLATFISLDSGAISIGGDGLTKLGMLNFNTGGAFFLQEDDSTELTGNNVADSANLNSDGAITDAEGTSIDVENAATFTAATSITLADKATDVIDIGSLATFVSLGADAIDVGVDVMMADGTDSGAQVNFGQLTFVSDDGLLGRGAVTIREDSSTEITGDNKASDLFLASAGAITDADSTQIDATGAATFTAQNEILLADASGDVLHVGGLATFTSVAGESITVGGDLSDTRFGSLTFNGGDVFIQEDDSTELTGVNVAASLNLLSSGAITDAVGTSVMVNGDATFTAADKITLADEATDELQIVGLAKFVSVGGATIDVGVDVLAADGSDSGAKVDFGQLTFVSDDGANGRGAVTIREDSSMEVTGVNLAASVFLAADGSIIQVEDGDAMTADRIDLDVNGDGTVVGDAVFEAASGGVINLFGDTTANPLGEPVSTFLADNKIQNAEFRAAGGGSLSDVYYRNISTAALFPMAPDTITGDLRVQFTNADIVVDDNVDVGDQLILEALGTMNSISDVDGVSIAANDGVFVADGTITLADESLNSLKVVENAFFYSRGGTNITVGASDADGTASGATVEFGSLTFYSGDGGSTRGDVVIHETNATELASRRFVVDGTPVIFINQADSLVLISDGALTDADSDGSMGETILRASVDVANSSVMIAGGQIVLADQALVTVDGVDLGVYSLGLSDNVEDNDIALFATTGGDDIRVGVADAVATDSGATVEVDGLNFYTDGGTGNVYLQTDSDTLLANRDFAGMTYENLANDVVLRTTGMIGSAGGETTEIVGDARFLATGDIMLVNSDPAALLVVGGNVVFQSGGAVSVGTGTSGANFGTLSFDAIGAVKITESNAAGSLVTPAAGMTITNTTFNGGSTNHAGSLTLMSDSFIEDAASTAVEVDGKATLTAKTTITLGDNAGDKFVVAGDASFISTDGKSIDLGVTPTTQLATDRGADSGATVEFGSLQFNSVGGDVTVHEDLGTLLAGDNQAGTLVLVANQGDVRDRTGTTINVSGFAEFHAENSVVLADEETNVLTIGGNALFTSGDSNYFATPVAVREISVGVVDVDTANNPNDPARGTDSGATVSLGSVTFNGFANMDAGAHVTIREDESMVITHAERREGGGSTEITNFAQTALLIADNSANDATITDSQIDGVGGTSIETTSYAVFQADSDIVLANEAADTLKIGDNAYFVSQLGDIDLGVTAKAINAFDRGADSGASVQFGTLTFVADIGDVTIHEDDDTTLSNDNPLRGTGSSANSLVLVSDGSIDDAAGTSLIVAQLTTAPTAGSAEDQVDGLAVLQAANDVHLGDSSGESIDLRRLSLSVGGDVSITETSATDGGLLLLDGSTTAGTLALKTNGHLVQINDERTGAVATTIFADQALLVAGGGIVMTNVDFNTATLQAHGTLQVTPGATLNADDAANGGLLGRRTTDAISSYLPDSNDDTFAPKGPSTTPDTLTNMDGAYSIVLSDVNSLTIGLVTDAKGTIAADPVTLAFDVANSDSMATADFKPALSAVGVSAGHMFVQTGGDLNFSENAADPLDNVVVFGEVRMTGGTVTNNAFTALVGGNLNINGDSMLVMRSAADFYMFNPDNNTLTPYVGGGLSDSVGSLGAVHTFATFVDVDTQPGFVQVGEFGPIYQRTAQSPDPDASTSEIAKGVGYGQFQVNATITQLGDSSTMDVNGQPVYVEQNQRVLVDWGDGSQSIYLFQDPINGAQTLQHVYSSNFALTEQRATVTITVYNDPQINLYDNVVDDTTFRDLNSVTDTFEVIIPVGVQFAPESPPFVQPSAPVVAPITFLPDVVFAVTTNSNFESDGGSLNQVQEVVVVIVNALDEEVGERVVLQGFSTIEEVKQYIQENTRFLPGRYKVSILLAGQQEPDVYFFEKTAADAQEGGSGAATSSGKFDGYVRVDGPHAAAEASAEQVWAAQYEKWFEADEEAGGEQAAPVAEPWTPDLSAVLLREERIEAEEEQTSLRKRWMLPGGIGGALMMAAYALRPQDDRERSAAVDEALEKPPEESTDAKFSVSRRRWRRRVR